MRGIRSSQYTGGAPVRLRPMAEESAERGPLVTKLSRNDDFGGVIPRLLTVSVDWGAWDCAWAGKVGTGCPGVHPDEKYWAPLASPAATNRLDTRASGFINTGGYSDGNKKSLDWEIQTQRWHLCLSVNKWTSSSATSYASLVDYHDYDGPFALLRMPIVVRTRSCWMFSKLRRLVGVTVNN